MVFRSVVTLILAALTACGALAIGVRCVSAEDFRVENKVYFGDDPEPRIESSTVFYEGVVYDFLRKPQEITVLDRVHHRFILLDVTRRVKTELSTDTIASLNEQLRRRAAFHSDDPLFKFLADPQFQESVEEATGNLVFTSPWLTYRVVLADPESPAIAEQYHAFSNWYAMLNTRLNPGAKPPFARISVNESLAKRHQLPKEVQLTIPSKKSHPFQKAAFTIRSEHVLIRQLVQSDRDRIKQTDEFMAVFQPVDFTQYQKSAE